MDVERSNCCAITLSLENTHMRQKEEGYEDGDKVKNKSER